jgi:hypothetical protein
MTISFPEAPTPARAAVLDALKKRGEAHSFLTPRLRDADPKTLDLNYPLRATYLRLDRIDPRKSQTLRHLVEPPLWRFLVTAGTTVIAAAYAVEDGAANWRLGEIAEGPSVEGTEVAIQAALKDERFVRLAFEPALVQAPALALVGLWLRGPEPDADWWMPIPPVSKPFIAFEVQAATSFVTHVTRLAATIPEHASARGG